MLKRSQLHQYQREIISKALSVPNLGLFLPPGLGKTTTTLTIIAEQMQGKTLIIAPKRVAETVWDAEVKKWEHLRHLRVSKIIGTSTQRMAGLNTDADIYLINLENVAWLCGLSDKLVFTNLVIDESSRFKDSSTKRFKALKKHLKGFQRRVIIKDKISDICFSLKAEDYLQLPSCTSLYQKIEVEPQVRNKYEQLKKDMVAEIGKQKITAPTAAALANKLLQFTSGAVYSEDGEAHEVHRAKLECLESIMEESSSPTLIFYHFKHSLQRLRLTFPDARDSTNRLV